ncbi:MAG TPA: DUF192 domain-containing protein [Longimicrobiaceae bacterium]|nr:DUF192 domain-containing protein [Longimicrobiaceae bacterium]
MRLYPIAQLLLTFALAACGDDRAADAPAEPLMAFDTATLRVASGADTAVLRVELATTDEQRAMGLMERASLPQDAGMLFWYPETQPDSGAFWMYRTRIPLDIAFVDSAGTIRAIHAMEPCTSPDSRWCPSYPAGAPFRGALEVNRGYFARRGIDVGDRLLLEEIGGPAGAGRP